MSSPKKFTPRRRVVVGFSGGTVALLLQLLLEVLVSVQLPAPYSGIAVLLACGISAYCAPQDTEEQHIAALKARGVTFTPGQEPLIRVVTAIAGELAAETASEPTDAAASDAPSDPEDGSGA